MLPYLLDLAYAFIGCMAVVTLAGVVSVLIAYTCTSNADDDATPATAETLPDFPALPGTAEDAR